jgi:hypothetical protein
MTGLFKKKTKKDDVGSLPSDMRDVGSQGRTDSMPTYHDVPIELQTIDKQLSKLKDDLKHAKSPTFFYGSESEYNTTYELQENKIFQMESEIRKLELKRVEVLNSLQSKNSNSISNNISTPFPKSEKKQKMETEPTPSSSESLQILKLRLAKGEITKEEFIELEKLVK